MQLENMVRGVIEDECEDYFFGIADLSIAERPIIEQEKSLIAEYPKAISIGITVHPILLKEILRKNESSTTNHYAKVLPQLNIITAHLSNLLQCEGYKALPMSIIEELGDTIISSISDELVANMAGLGQIGSDGSLITQEVGSEVLWSTIFTDAPLKVTGKSLKQFDNLNDIK